MTAGGDPATRFSLSPGAAAGLDALLRLIVTDDHAPTTVRDPRQGRDTHVADSLVGLEISELRTARTIADLGAGAGFPGIPLALALPLARVSLVESAVRKCGFLERAIAAAGAENAVVVHTRAEAWPAGIGAQEVVTARALAPLAVLVEYAAPLLRRGGVLVAWKGRRDAGEEAGGARAAELLGLAARPALRVEPAPGLGERHLHVFEKVTETPVRFPRRPGMARKRPIGA
jgi:16S rRNA (guanine527-N7)-methyltransferase